VNGDIHDQERPAADPSRLALLFGRAFGQSPQYWLNLQTAYDLKLAERSIGKRLKSVSELEAA
jgi:plasmid maintenance system antidote protein VapI